MRKFISLLGFLMLMPLMVFAKDPDSVEIDGIFYILNENSANVTRNPNNYEGDIIIPESVSSGGKNYKVCKIESNAFYNCAKVTSIKLPEGLEYIESTAFYGCTGLKSINLPNSLFFIGNHAFGDCISLNEISIPSNEYNTSVGHEFFNCSGLTSINIPSTIKSVSGFYGCTGLTSIIIPKNVTEIAECTFQNCIGLENIIVESENPIYDSRDNCNAIIETKTNKIIVGCKNTKFPSSINTIGSGAFGYCTVLKDLDIPNSIHTIENNAFSGCTGLQNLNLPESIISIGMGAFNGCENLTSITIPNSLDDISSVFTNCTSLRSIDIPDGINNISDAFTGCTSLSSVSFTNSVKKMYMAFFYCIGLKSITIPDGISIIDGEAFSYSGLETVVIPNTIHSIERNSFANCKELKDFYSYAEVAPILDQYSFYKTDISKAILHVPSGSVDLYKNAAIWKDFGRIEPISKSDNPSYIETLKSDKSPASSVYYTIDGRKHYQLQKGLNILRIQNGKVVKRIGK